MVSQNPACDSQYFWWQIPLKTLLETKEKPTYLIKTKAWYQDLDWRVSESGSSPSARGQEATIRINGRTGRPGRKNRGLHQQGCTRPSWRGKNSSGRKVDCILSSLHTLSTGFAPCRGEDGKSSLSERHHNNPTKETDVRSRKDLRLQGLCESFC